MKDNEALWILAKLAKHDIVLHWISYNKCFSLRCHRIEESHSLIVGKTIKSCLNKIMRIRKYREMVYATDI
mgnify:CR=1 FL=1